MVRGGVSKTTRRANQWLDSVFFAGWEVSVLALPTLWFLLFATPREAVSLSGLTALVVAALAVGTYRGGYVDTGSWPRPGHLPTLPIRSAYYSLVVGGTTMLGATAQAELGAFWVGIAVPTLLGFAGFAVLPAVVAGAQRAARATV